VGSLLIIIMEVTMEKRLHQAVAEGYSSESSTLGLRGHKTIVKVLWGLM
jgi:hypothetical protein